LILELQKLILKEIGDKNCNKFYVRYQLKGWKILSVDIIQIPSNDGDDHFPTP
jgi:hypothetical protein